MRNSCPILLMALIAFGCGAGAEPTNGSAPNILPPPVIDTSPYPRQTTAPQTAIQNLQSQVAAYEEILKSTPGNAFVRSALVDALLARTAFLGSYRDFDLALQTVADWPLEDAESQRLAHARVLSALHRFPEALALLSAAPMMEASKQRESIAIATGADLEQVWSQRLLRAQTVASFSSLADAATAAAAVGRYMEADELYRQAIDAYPDVSPLPLAFVYFQRGLMWAEMANRPDVAKPLYEEAVRLLPQYVVANVHLAELEAEAGGLQRAEAIARLAAIAAQTYDPEPLGLAGELLLATGDSEGISLVNQAAARYRDLLTRHRAAFSDHAAEFFSGPGGDPTFALQLALDNLALRPTPRAYLVALNAAEAAGDSGLVCNLASGAANWGASHETLRARLVQLKSPCR